MHDGDPSPRSSDDPEVVRVAGTVHDAGPNELADLLRRLRDQTPEGRLSVGVTATPEASVPVELWANRAARALADDVNTLVVDLGTPTEEPGLTEVAAGTSRWVDVVTVDPHRRLARVGAGAAGRRAVGLLGEVLTTIPRDVQVVLVPLAPLDDFTTLAAAGRLDRLVVLAPASGDPGTTGSPRAAVTVPGALLALVPHRPETTERKHSAAPMPPLFTARTAPTPPAPTAPSAPLTDRTPYAPVAPAPAEVAPEEEEPLAKRLWAREDANARRRPTGEDRPPGTIRLAPEDVWRPDELDRPVGIR